MPPERMLPDATPTTTTSGYYTVGTRFTVNTPGQITHVRYWYQSGGTTRDLAIWSAGGVRLATVTDSVPAIRDEPLPADEGGVSLGDIIMTQVAPGWREVALPTPLVVTAATTYTTSQYTTGWFYAFTTGTFTSLTPNLTIIDGYYFYGGDGFPNVGALATYHVDVVYIPDAVVPKPRSYAVVV